MLEKIYLNVILMSSMKEDKNKSGSEGLVSKTFCSVK